MRTEQKPLVEIVKENYRSAAALYDFGLDFFETPNRTLSDLCTERCLNMNLVVKHIRRTYHRKLSLAPFEPYESMSLPEVISALKHSHRHFMRKQLPYMNKLIQDARIHELEFPYDHILGDLKIAFPLFAEDFARHILDEENELFHYVLKLFAVEKKQIPTAVFFFEHRRKSIESFAHAHDHDDDNMRGIRELTHDYECTDNTPLLVRVLYSELKDFEDDLCFHAAVEDEVLIPKAYLTEQKLRNSQKNTSKLN